MFAPALGMLTAVWLLCAPFVELETGPQMVAAVVVGLAAIVLAPLSVWSRSAGFAMALFGVGLAMINFVTPGSAGSMADLATSGVVLAIAGLAPAPVVHVLPAVVPAKVTRGAAKAPAVEFRRQPATATA